MYRCTGVGLDIATHVFSVSIRAIAYTVQTSSFANLRPFNVYTRPPDNASASVLSLGLRVYINIYGLGYNATR